MLCDCPVSCNISKLFADLILISPMNKLTEYFSISQKIFSWKLLGLGGISLRTLSDLSALNFRTLIFGLVPHYLFFLFIFLGLERPYLFYWKWRFSVKSLICDGLSKCPFWSVITRNSKLDLWHILSDTFMVLSQCVFGTHHRSEHLYSLLSIP